jgi:hypothetical protein
VGSTSALPFRLLVPPLWHCLCPFWKYPALRNLLAITFSLRVPPAPTLPREWMEQIMLGTQYLVTYALPIAIFTAGLRK